MQRLHERNFEAGKNRNSYFKFPDLALDGGDSEVKPPPDISEFKPVSYLVISSVFFYPKRNFYKKLAVKINDLFL
jgi:hypothetical protein